MIRFRIRELIAELAFHRGTRVTMDEVAQATGIHRATLSKIASSRGTNTTTDNLDRLCAYFGCTWADLAVYIPDSEVDGES
jgi:putative transcriptional regulator